MKRIGFLLIVFLFLLIKFSNAQYCASNATITNGTKIDTVIIGNTTFSSPYTLCETYTDRTATPVTIASGVPVNLRVRTGSCTNTQYRMVSAFIDWNNDFDFNDPGEQLGLIDLSNYTASAANYTFIVPYGTFPSPKRLRIVCQATSTSTFSLTSGCSTYPYGETEDYTLNLTPFVGVDAAALNLTSPVAPLIQNTQVPVSFSIANFATDTLRNANLVYQLNNLPPIIQNWSGSLGYDQSEIFTFDSLLTIPNASNFSLKVWIAQANGLGQEYNTSNDTITISRCTGLIGGTYTVGTINSDFPTLQTAFNKLSCGITGPVIMAIEPGNYLGLSTLQFVPGASQTNTITITAAAGSDNNVILGPLINSSTKNQILKINGAEYVTISNLNFRNNTTASGSGVGSMILFENQANNGAILNCTIIDTSTLTQNSSAIRFFNSNNANVTGNTIVGFWYSIELEGINDTTLIQGANIANNHLTEYWTSTIFFKHINNCVINENYITNYRGILSYTSVFEGENTRNLTISNNRAINNLPGFGLLTLTNFNGNNQEPNYLINNVFSGNIKPQVSFTNFTRCLNLRASYQPFTGNRNLQDHLIISNNTFNIGFQQTIQNNADFIYLLNQNPHESAVSKIEVNNNIFRGYTQFFPNGTINQARLYYIPSILLMPNFHSKNNLFWLTNPGHYNIGKIGNSTSVNWSTWQNGYGQDSNSVERNPMITDVLIPIPTNPLANNLGAPTSSTPTDILGNLRNTTTPDVGAYEFNLSSNNAGVTEIISPVNGCAGFNSGTVTVQVKNLGINNLSNIPVSYILNGNPPITAIVPGTLTPGNSVNFTFPGTAVISSSGTYNLVSYTSFPTDVQTQDDSISKKVFVFANGSATFPFTENFENGTGGWITDGENSSWARGFPNSTTTNGILLTAASGNNAWVTNLNGTDTSGGYNNMENSYLISPCFNFSNLGNAELRMNLAVNTHVTVQIYNTL